MLSGFGRRFLFGGAEQCVDFVGREGGHVEARGDRNSDLVGLRRIGREQASACQRSAEASEV